MANFYWYGSSGNWSDFTNHWSGNSGNSPASPKANAPTSSDDVFIDSSSGFGGGGTITVDGAFECHDFICSSGHTFTFTASASKTNYIGGNFQLESGMTIGDNIYFKFNSIDLTATITTDGVTLSQARFVYPVSATYTLLDDLVTSGHFYMENGTFDANDHNVTANDFYFYADTGFTPTIIMGSGTWEATGSGATPVWYTDEYSGEVVTITPETSTIKLSNVVNANKWFEADVGGVYAAGTKTYHDLWISGQSTTNPFVISGTFIFDDFKISTAPNNIWFVNGKTQTVTSFTVSGTVGNLIKLDSGDQINQFTLSKSSGVVSCDYLDISNSNATGGAVWGAGLHSVNTTNNTGWIFALHAKTLASMGVG